MGRSQLSIAILVGLAGSMLGCGPASGSRDYYVEVDDVVVDPYGRTQPSLCADYVRFTGDIDTRCGAQPMTWSYAQSAVLDCEYKDSAAVTRYYADTFFFPAGYIREPSCTGVVAYLGAPDAARGDAGAERTAPEGGI
jgi:hypothetical protein